MKAFSSSNRTGQAEDANLRASGHYRVGSKAPTQALQQLALQTGLRPRASRLTRRPHSPIAPLTLGWQQ